MPNKRQVLAELEVLFELVPGALTGDEALAGIPQWDSLGMIGTIAMLDGKFATRVTFERLTACRTPTDICALLGDKLGPG